MFCRFCGKEMDDHEVVCPACGKKNKKPVDMKKVRKIAFSCVASVLLLAILAGMIYYGVTGMLPFMQPERANDVYYKGNYTVDAQQALAQREQVVATMGEHSLTSGQLQAFYGMQVIDYLNNYYYGYEFDYTKPLDNQICDKETGLSWQQYFLQNALNTWRQYRLLTDAALEAGYELPKEQQEHLDNLEQITQEMAEKDKFESVQAMLQADLGAGCNFDDYKYYMTLHFTANLYFSHITNELEITQAEIEEYFTKNEAKLKQYGITKTSGPLVDVRHILVGIAGGEEVKNEDGTTSKVYSEADWEACRVKAQEIWDQWKAGDKTEASFAVLANEKTEDPGNNNSGGLCAYTAKGQMVKEFEDWCFDESRQKGDTGLVKTKFGYHIMYFVTSGDGWIRLSESGVRDEKSTALLKEITEKDEVQADFKSIVLGQYEMKSAS